MKNSVLVSDTVQTRLEGIVKGAIVVREQDRGDTFCRNDTDDAGRGRFVSQADLHRAGKVRAGSIGSEEMVAFGRAGRENQDSEGTP